MVHPVLLNFSAKATWKISAIHRFRFSYGIFKMHSTFILFTLPLPLSLSSPLLSSSISLPSRTYLSPIPLSLSHISLSLNLSLFPCISLLHSSISVSLSYPVAPCLSHPLIISSVPLWIIIFFSIISLFPSTLSGMPFYCCFHPQYIFTLLIRMKVFSRKMPFFSSLLFFGPQCIWHRNSRQNDRTSFSIQDDFYWDLCTKCSWIELFWINYLIEFEKYILGYLLSML